VCRATGSEDAAVRVERHTDDAAKGTDAATFFAPLTARALHTEGRCRTTVLQRSAIGFEPHEGQTAQLAAQRVDAEQLAPFVVDERVDLVRSQRTSGLFFRHGT
jgi:hypothetical protein